uniref:THAP-type domain-containing protein n=1 Tax=Lygus hesperus TaxID=30085 RepID=A0A146LJ11_LYGHE
MDKYVRCAVRTCSNNSKKTGNRIRYFRFPRDEDLLTLWTVRCDRRDTWTPSTSFVCSSHFIADDYIEVTPGISRLHPEAVPSRNLGYDWDNNDQADVMMMEEDFTSDDDENNDSIARALMSMSGRTSVPIPPATPVVNYPLTGTFNLGSDYPSTSTQPVPNQAKLNKTDDPNLIVITDINKKYKTLRQLNSKTQSAPKKRPPKKMFCCVPTCSAYKGKDKDFSNGFHYFPRGSTERMKWIRAIFHNDLFIKKSRLICRRHFTTDDYKESPRSGALPRLRIGAVPSQNIPICESESLLARKKLWMDVFRRKPEDKNLTFVQQLAREPELQELLQRFVQDALKIDPRRAQVVPYIPRRGDLKGCGVPVQGTGIKPEKKKKKSNRKKTFEEMTEEEQAEYLAKKAKREQEKKELQKLRALRRSVRRKQLSEERKMKLFEEKLERLELRKSNPQAYHELLAEERLMQRQEELAKKIANGKYRFILSKSENLSITSDELKKLKESDPEAYSRLLADSLVSQRKEKLAKKLTDVASVKNPVKFSDKIEIIANDPEKGGKYKVIVKKVLNKRNMNKDYISQLNKNKTKSMEIVRNVIKDIDFSKVKRIKFAETEKLTKISRLRSLGIDVQGLGMIKDPPDKEVAPGSSEEAAGVEPTATGEDILGDVPQDHAEGHNFDEGHFGEDNFGDDHHSNIDPFEGVNCPENVLDDVTDGYDHSYTNKTSQPNEDPRPNDPFEELKNQLQALPEDVARALVKEKMDSYKETFMKQMTRMRALLQSKKKIDRKVKMLTRALCLSLSEQYVKYYKN